VLVQCRRSVEYVAVVVMGTMHMVVRCSPRCLVVLLQAAARMAVVPVEEGTAAHESNRCADALVAVTAL
jgi:hypothetical protein